MRRRKNAGGVLEFTPGRITMVIRSGNVVLLGYDGEVDRWDST